LAKDAVGHAGGRRTAPELLVFTWKVLIVIGAVALAYAVSHAVEVLLLVFAGLLFAIFLLQLAGYLTRWTGLPRRAALGVVLLLLLGLAVLGAWRMSAMVTAEYGRLSEAVTGAYAALPAGLRSQLGQGTSLGAWIDRLHSLLPPILFGIADLLVVLFSGIYFAVSPELYQRGLVLLLPADGRARAREVLHVIGQSLWLWLVGQLCAMALVGALVAFGLWLLGNPVPFQLGILAGLLEFVPYAGPVLAAAPAVLIAFAQSPTEALWVALLYTGIQQVEGQLIQPLVQRAAIDLPPVLTIAAIAAGGLLFGLIGVIVATPLTICILVCVNMLYLADHLGEDRHFPPPDKVSEAAPPAEAEG
jgi:predicted PurR-regulated permease PerM